MGTSVRIGGIYLSQKSFVVHNFQLGFLVYIFLHLQGAAFPLSVPSHCLSRDFQSGDVIINVAGLELEI